TPRGTRAKPPGPDVEPLAVDEDGNLALEDVERLLFVHVDVQRRRGAARVDRLHLREAAGRLLAGHLDPDPAGLPPDVCEPLAGGEGVRDGCCDRSHLASFGRVTPPP